MQLFRRKSSATIRPQPTESTSSSPPYPSSPTASSTSETIPTISRGIFRRKSSVNIRSSTDSPSSEETPSIPRRLFRRKSNATIRPSTANPELTASSPSQENSPRPYTSTASPPPIPIQFLPPSPPPVLENPAIVNLASNTNRASNRFSTTSTLFEREIPTPVPAPRPSPLSQVQQPNQYEAYVSQARETDLQQLGHNAMMALAWVQAEERRRAVTSRGWQHDPWRGGFGPSGSSERRVPIVSVPVPVQALRVTPVLRVETAQVGGGDVVRESPRIEVQERSGNGLRERLGRRGLMKSQSIFNMRWRVRDVV